MARRTSTRSVLRSRVTESAPKRRFLNNKSNRRLPPSTTATGAAEPRKVARFRRGRAFPLSCLMMTDRSQDRSRRWPPKETSRPNLRTPVCPFCRVRTERLGRALEAREDKQRGESERERGRKRAVLRIAHRAIRHGR